jgi:flagellar hook-associated protein 3 FlgL
MRVSTQMYPQALLGQLGKLTHMQQKLQNQVSTGLRVQEASDDPSSARKIIVWQGDLAAIEQFRKNIEAQQNLAKMNDGVFQDLHKISSRAREIAISGVDGTKPADILATMAQEVDGLIERALSVGNRQIGGKYLLSGTIADTLPFKATRDANNQITGVAFQGNSNVAAVDASPNESLSAQWVGGNDGDGGQPGLLQDAASGVDIFRDLVALRDHLASGDIDAIKEQDNQRLADLNDHILFFGAANGAMEERMNISLSSLKDQEFALTGMISREGDADMADTIVRLNEVQYAYQAALQSGAKIMNSSLMDYLR